VAITYSITRLDTPPYKIDQKKYAQFEQRKNVFGRMLYDKKAPFYQKSMYMNTEKIIAQNRKGYSRIEFARVLAAPTIHDYFEGAFSWKKLQNRRGVMSIPTLEQYPVSDPVFMSKEIKKTAKIFGASVVGITKLDERWLYSYAMDGKQVEIADEYTYAIVTAIAMDNEAIRTSPAYSAHTETGLTYSRMAFTVACLAEFIRYLGYKAIPIGNDIALSIPLALDAGLGELGRHGLLITPEFGPCVRLCKVFTDLPLEPDKPIEFGVADYCRSCDKCVIACEEGAIQSEKEPSYAVVCSSNNPGILRWAVNHDKCYQFWLDNGSECSNCIAACPFDPRNDSG